MRSSEGGICGNFDGLCGLTAIGLGCILDLSAGVADRPIFGVHPSRMPNGGVGRKIFAEILVMADRIMAKGFITMKSFFPNAYELHHQGKHSRAFLSYFASELGLLKTGLLATKIVTTAFRQKYGLPPVMGPLYVGLDITYQCMCRCSFCNRWNIRDGNELLTQEYTQLFEEFKKIGVHAVVIGGGEPLLHPDILNILRRLHQLGIKVNLCTNGYLLDDLASDLLDTGIEHITVSLDSVNPEIHDQLRGTRGLYRRAEQGIEHIVRARRGVTPFVRARMVVHEQNFREIPQFLAQWRGKVDRCLIQPLHVYEGGDYHNISTNTMQPIHAIDELKSLIATDEIRKDFYVQHMPCYLEHSDVFRQFPCYAGYLFTRIDPFGNLYPCIGEYHLVGNIRERSFSSLWYSQSFNQLRRDQYRNRACTCWYNDNTFLNSYMWLLNKKLFGKSHHHGL